MILSRPPLPVVTVPDGVLFDPRLDDLAFRIWCVLHAETYANLLVDDEELARAARCTPSALQAAFRVLESAGYLVRRIDGDWEIVG